MAAQNRRNDKTEQQTRLLRAREKRNALFRSSKQNKHRTPACRHCHPTRFEPIPTSRPKWPQGPGKSWASGRATTKRTGEEGTRGARGEGHRNAPADSTTDDAHDDDCMAHAAGWLTTEATGRHRRRATRRSSRATARRKLVTVTLEPAPATWCRSWGDASRVASRADRADASPTKIQQAGYSAAFA